MTSPAHRIDQLLADYHNAAPRICIARARAVTRAYRETPGAPAIIKKAKAFEYTCEQIPVAIYPGELVVGASGTHRRSAGVSPEISWQWIKKEIDTIGARAQDPYGIDPGDRRELMEEILPWWAGRSVEEAFLSRLPNDTAAIAVDTGIIDNDSKWRCAVGEITPDYQDILFKQGFSGILDHARARYGELDLSCPGHTGKADFYQAAICCARGMIRLGERYALAADRLAAVEKNTARKKELLDIAANCRIVPACPPQNFWQAVQMVWFVQLGSTLFENAVALNLGRFDQYTHPFYAQDLKTGRITPDEAQERVDCLWIKLSEWVWFVSKNTADYFAGYNAFQNLTVGGKTPDGTDGTNAVSYMCLEAAKRTRTHQPGLSVRIHPDGPRKFLSGVCALVKEGMGFPAIHNDRIGTQMLTAAGLSHRDATDWSNCGCVVPHARQVSEWTSACNINLAAAAEFVMTGGRHRSSGVCMGLDTGGVRAIPDFATFREHYFIQVRHMIRHAVIATLTAQQVQAELAPRPYFSAFTKGCMASGRDVVRGGARYHVGPVLTGIGLADAANALAVVRHLVFEKGMADLGMLEKALESNWHGFETLHEQAKACPKFGNDDARADQYAAEISNLYHEEIAGYTDIYGSRFNSAFMGISSYIPAGRVVGATPCGRKAGDPLTEGCSPHAGTDVTSPTAAMRSAARINHGRHAGGTLLNIKLSPDTLATKQDLNRLAGLIRGYFELDAFHVQFNVVDRETLEEAQQHPERHPGLMVRVAGYSARFTTLSREVQDAIIQRTSYTAI